MLEWLICGDTKIPAGEMKRAMERLFQTEIQTGQNGYETQFKVIPTPTHILLSNNNNIMVQRERMHNTIKGSVESDSRIS